jgi:hypothetical protein
VAEITWEDDSGMSFRAPGVLEDTSRSGACVRLKRPHAVGSRITIKWHREQFPAIARNCRKDGGDFLLGVWREAEIASATKSASHSATIDARGERMVENPAGATHTIAAPGQSRQPFQNAVATAPPRPRTASPIQGPSLRPERTVMQPKTIFPHFWRRKQDEDAPQNRRSRRLQ